MKDIVIIGSGGLGREVKCLIDDINQVNPQWNLIGFIDSWGKKIGETVIADKKVVGGIEYLNESDIEINAVIAMGLPKRLIETASLITNQNVTFANLIHPETKKREDLIIGRGNIIFAAVYISCNVNVSNFNIINLQCQIGHDAIIGSYNVLNPNVHISGNTKVGERNLFGLNSSVLQGKRINDNNNIGACSLIMEDIKSDGSYFGIPAKRFF